MNPNRDTTPLTDEQLTDWLAHEILGIHLLGTAEVIARQLLTIGPLADRLTPVETPSGTHSR